jgi:regulator of protease activity HflC (stomatin/prohibitin superfamily)
MILLAIASVIVLASVAIAGLHQIREDERGVVLRFGAFRRTEMPGLRFALPKVDQLMRVPVMSINVEDQYQENCQTQDGTKVAVRYLVRLRVVDAAKALLKIDDWRKASLTQADVVVRSAMATRNLADILTEWPRLGPCLSADLYEATCAWGVLPEVDIADVSVFEKQDSSNSSPG